MKNNSPYVISLKETNKFNQNKDYYFLNRRKQNESRDQSPKSGSEPKFEPEKWNNNDNIKHSHNCYAYLLNTIVGKRDGKPQPGYFSNFPPIRNKDYTCESFFQRLKKDIPSLYLTTFSQKCKKGFYKGFIALDPKMEDQDYHFYRHDQSGFWSHKPGRTEAVNIDADNKIIKNPLKANRNYRFFNYSRPCFFFCLNNKLSRSRSRSKHY